MYDVHTKFRAETIHIDRVMIKVDTGSASCFAGFPAMPPPPYIIPPLFYKPSIHFKLIRARSLFNLTSPPQHSIQMTVQSAVLKYGISVRV